MVSCYCRPCKMECRRAFRSRNDRCVTMCPYSFPCRLFVAFGLSAFVLRTELGLDRTCLLTYRGLISNLLISNSLISNSYHSATAGGPHYKGPYYNCFEHIATYHEYLNILQHITNIWKCGNIMQNIATCYKVIFFNILHYFLIFCKYSWYFAICSKQL